jgi:hypothetical protein|tara:strand:+ start:514 stop:1221 length:708 start_codon:yes stop_codon:yes gene_type:complete
MARISTYDKAVPVVAEDKWIGSDSQNRMRTRNFTAQDVADFINKKGGEDQNLRYTYNDTTGYITGSISFTNGAAANVLLNSITTFNVGVYDLRSSTLNISEFITNALVGTEVLLTQTNNLNNWAIYSWDSAVARAGNLEYVIQLTFKAGGGSLIAGEDYFISLLTNDAGNISNFTIALPGNSLSYLITHNMNKYPSVSVFESGTNDQVFGNVTYNNLNQCTITFSSLVTGTATFN